MPSLANLKHEAVAQALARGLGRRAALLFAGFSASTAEVKAGKVCARPDIIRRVHEICARAGVAAPLNDGAQHRVRPAPQRAPQRPQPRERQRRPEPQPREAEQPRAEQPRTEHAPPPPPPQDAEPAFMQQPILQPPRPLSRVDLPKAGPAATRDWLLDTLHELAHEAHHARDRRTVVAATAEIGRLSGLHSQRLDLTVRSVLDGLPVAALVGLIAALERGDRFIAAEPGARDVEFSMADEDEECLDPLA